MDMSTEPVIFCYIHNIVMLKTKVTTSRFTIKLKRFKRNLKKIWMNFHEKVKVSYSTLQKHIIGPKITCITIKSNHFP